MIVSRSREFRVFGFLELLEKKSVSAGSDVPRGPASKPVGHPVEMGLRICT